MLHELAPDAVLLIGEAMDEATYSTERRYALALDAMGRSYGRPGPGGGGLEVFAKTHQEEWTALPSTKPKKEHRR